MMHNYKQLIRTVLVFVLFVLSIISLDVFAQPNNNNNNNNTNNNTNNTTNNTDNNTNNEQPAPPPPVYKCKFSDSKIEKLFSPTVEYSASDKTFFLKINHDTLNDAGKRVVFVVKKIGNSTNVTGVGGKVSYGNSLRLDRKTIEAAAVNDVVSFTIQSTNYGNCHDTKYCVSSGTSQVEENNCSSSVTITFEHDIGGGQLLYPAKNLEPIASSVEFVNKVTCDSSKLANYRDEANTLSGSSNYSLFVKRYCMAKIMAEKQGNDFIEGQKTLNQVRSVKGLKCNEWTINANEVAKISGVEVLTDKDIEQGYRNATYYEASYDRDVKLPKLKYRHRLDPYSDYQYENVDLGCKINCTEVVKTAYQPPIASKAGFCFEYKIKVESTVSCKVVTGPPPPNSGNYSYCYPSPACHHPQDDGTDKVGVSAGPTEDFDECIMNCDGGKYSNKCSKKCYNEVYKEYLKSNRSKLNYFSDDSKVMKMANTQTSAQLERLNDCVKKASNGCYYRLNGEVFFKPKSMGTVNGYTQWMAGTYYIKRGAGPKHEKWNYKDFVVSREDGFFRKIFDSGQICPAKCEWVEGDCEGKYLNEESGYAEEDWKYNKKIYEQAVAECNAGASCSTSEAVYTMSVDYENDSGKHTVYFPDGEVDNDAAPDNFDKLISVDDGTCPNSTKKECSKVNSAVVTEADKFNTSGIKCNNHSTLIDYGGCYVCSKARNYYMTEMNFPGTWINNKTAEISYQKQGDGWRKEDKKYCVPLDAKNVNPLWWIWYMKKTSPNEKISEIEKYVHECMNIDSIPLKTLQEYANETRDYNIHASVTNFGYYGWNFNFSCFYALNKNGNPTPPVSIPDNPELCIPIYSNYKLRAIDLGDMFPSQDGTPLNKNEEATNTGRVPGFNWSSYATITYDKDKYMATNPTSLLGAIQKREQEIYDENKEDSYLDYEFFLSPATLLEIRKVSGKNSYANDLNLTVTGSDGQPTNHTYGFSDNNFNLCGHRVYTSSLIDYLNTMGAVKKRVNINGEAKCCNNPDGKGGCELFGIDVEH